MDSDKSAASPIRRKSKRRGQALLEFALLLPLLLLFVFGVVDLGRAFFVSVTLSNAAREGARYAVLNINSVDLSGSPNWVFAAKNAAAKEGNDSGLVLSAGNIKVYCPPNTVELADNAPKSSCTRGSPIKVEASSYFELVMGWILPSPISLKQSVEMILP